MSSDLHPFIMNSVPKSGTHLLKQLLLGMNPNVIKNNPYHGIYGLPEENDKDSVNRLNQMEPNQFINGHLFYSDDWRNLFKKNNLKQIFLVRDLRDIIVSYTLFIDKLPTHSLYNHFKNNIRTSKDRYLLLINGINEPQQKLIYPSIDHWFKCFQPWMDDSNVLTVKFENLIECSPDRKRTLEKIISFLWEDGPLPVPKEEMVKNMIANVNPKASPTFRKGIAGDWKNEFDKLCKKAFKEKAGELLIDLDYEKDLNW